MSKSPVVALPLWLRIVFVVAIVVGWYVFQQQSGPSTAARTPSGDDPPVAIKVLRNEPAAASQEQPQVSRAPTTSKPQVANQPSPPSTVPQPKAVTKSGPAGSSTDAQKSANPAKPDKQETAKVPTAPKTDSAADAEPVMIRKVKLKDQSGRVIFEGDVDLTPTLERVAAGKRLDRFPHDGTTFQNRERRLPQKPSGYYKEYVVPTVGQNGPGPQRLVTGNGGEVWYTHDHYKSFRKIR